MEEPQQREDHSWKSAVLPLKGVAVGAGPAVGQDQAASEAPDPSLHGNPREEDTLFITGRRPCLRKETQKVLPKPQAQAIQWGMDSPCRSGGGEESWDLWPPEVASLLTLTSAPYL